MSEHAQLNVHIPPFAIAAYIACVAGGGALANCSIIAAVLKSSRHGLFCIILQLAIADILLEIAVSLELWSSNAKTWVFGNSGCVIYRSLQVLASTASSYFVVTVAMHTIATINIEEKTKKFKRRHREDEELRSSRHSLVTSSDSSTPPRTMNLDYRLTDTRVSVLQPILFIWVISISTSIPEFLLATPLHLGHSIQCTIIDSSRRQHLYSILALVNLFLPTAIMIIVGIQIIFKIKSIKKLPQIECNIASSLKLSLWQISINVALCAPRSFLNAYDIYSSSLIKQEVSYSEKIQESNCSFLIELSFISAYLAATLARPILCITMLPRLRQAFSFNSEIDGTDHV